VNVTFDEEEMKTNITLLAVFCMVSASAIADMPPTNQVAKYERCDSEWTWREVPKSEGETVLASLRDIAHFKTWGSTVPAGFLAQPIPAVLAFRVVSTSGETNVVHFSSRGELVDCQIGLLVVPDKEEEILAQLLARWRKADNTRISSQPLPCKYRIGSADDGGTLSGIARLFYGDATKWREIYEANRSVIKNPDIIQGREVITIPKPKDSDHRTSR
jgi:hypothetical protein